jgi:hypothetical protein
MRETVPGNDQMDAGHLSIASHFSPIQNYVACIVKNKSLLCFRELLLSDCHTNDQSHPNFERKSDSDGHIAGYVERHNLKVPRSAYDSGGADLAPYPGIKTIFYSLSNWR